MNRLRPDFNNSDVLAQKQLAYANSTFMSQVYFWMVIGLAISGATAYYVANNPAILAYIFQSKAVLITLFILQFAAVVVLTSMINRLNATFATLLYLGYSLLTGLTLSTIFIAYTQASIAQAFFLTAFSFAGLSIFGYVTKRDLGPVGSFCTIGLFGVIGLMLLTLFFPSMQSNALSMTINVMCIIIFAGLTAYDTQKIKNFNTYQAGSDVVRKQAVMGALMLYLDVINLFLSILQLMGRRK